MGAGFDYRAVMIAVAELMQEAMLAYPGGAVDSTAFSYSFQAYSTYPYFTMRPANIGITSDSEELDAAGFDVIIDLFAGKVTSGQSGEREIELQSWIGHIIQYCNERETLQSKKYPNGVDNIDHARINACLGVVKFSAANNDTPDFGTQFTLRVTARYCLGLDYDGDGY